MHEHTHRWLRFKLTAIVIGVTVVALGLFSLFAAERVGRMESEAARTALLDKGRMIRDMLAVNNDSMNVAAEKLFAVFQSMLAGDFSLEETLPVVVGGRSLAVLRLDGEAISPDFVGVDAFREGSGGHPATIFVRNGDDFVRLATSLEDGEGQRAVGTLLGADHPGYHKLIAGQTYSGYARLFDRPYMTHYEPILDTSGRVIGLLFVGLDVSEAFARLKEHIQTIRVGKSGYVFVLDTSRGASFGDIIIHPTHEGANVLAVSEPDERALFAKILASSDDRVDQYRFRAAGEQNLRDKVTAFAVFPEWHWVIGVGAYVDEFTKARRNLMGAMLGAMIVAALAIIVALSTSIRRLVLAPLLALHETLSASEGRFRTLVGSTDDIIYTVDCDGRCTGVFGKWLEAQGKNAADFIGRRPSDVFNHDGEVFETAHTLALRGAHRVFDWTGAPGATQVVLQISLSPMYNDNGQICGLVGIGRDVTTQRQAAEKLQLASSVFSHAREGIMITTPDSTIIEVNAAFTRITGYRRDEVIGETPSLLRSGRQGPDFYAHMWRSLVDDGHWSGEVWNRRRDGEVYAEVLTISAVRNAAGTAQHYVAIFSDVTAQKSHQQELEHIAHYDALTRLPNRVLLGDRLNQALAQAKRRKQHLAVAYIDLDGFKAINDDYGHDAGDRLLVALASRMKQCLREGDTIARLGGDEFVAVLVDLADIQASVPLILRLLTALGEPVQSEGLSLKVSGSIGVSFYDPAEDCDADLLLRQADQAMYQAKQAGKHRYHVFDAEHDRNMRGHHENIERIRQALAADEFVLHYQPKVNLRSGRLIGAEALVRWAHPERGLLAPAHFLPAIEDHPVGVALGEWVIDTALSQIEAWQRLGLDVPVSVNIAARHIQQLDFAERLQNLLGVHPSVEPDRLELEVLENCALENIDHVSAVIGECTEIGVRFALDDFGTGYSSLTYLKRLPVNVLKIDQSFVRDMLDNPDDLAILHGVMGLAVAFGREVIAEGVETVAHGVALLRLGCETAQGYGIARPMPAADVPAWRHSWHPDPSWAQTPRLDRDQLPVLIAGSEHRAWILALGEYFDGKRAALPPFNHHQCRFGCWLDSIGYRPIHQADTFAVIEELHLQVHAYAAELLELHRQGLVAEVRAGLPQLHALRDSLLVQLDILLVKDSPGGGAGMPP